MRSELLLSAVFVASFVLAPDPSYAQTSAAEPGTRTCAVDGLWTARGQAFTTRIQGGRWQTWSGTTIDEHTPPAWAGWLEITHDRLTFDIDNRRMGYGYTYSFEDGCDVLHLRGTAEILFVRATPSRTQ